jgi:putative flippase GtrA
MSIKNSKETSRFFRFAIVGSVGAIIDFVIFNLFTLLNVLPGIWAQVISFTCAVFSNFTWNRIWTYPDSRTKSLSKQFLQFVVVSVAGLLIRTPLFAWLEKVLTQIGEKTVPSNYALSPVFLGHNFSLAIVIFVVMIWNFLINRYWTYNDVN